MHIVQHQGQFAPHSMGVLMEPAFLRRACDDGLLSRHTQPDSRSQADDTAHAVWKRCWDFLAHAGAAKRAG